MGSVGPQRQESYNFGFFHGIKPKFQGFVRNLVVTLTLCEKRVSHTCDLQTKAFQGHYLKQKGIVKLQNISLIDTVHFV